MVPSHVPSVFLGLHYFLGRDPKPRVVEAHLALLLPDGPGGAVGAGGAQGGAASTSPVGGGLTYDKYDPDSWVLSTFAAVERRVLRGLYTGSTVLAEEKHAGGM